ncbi:hypothetical protein SAMN05192565_107181 [Methylobacterium gossipiicola]|uniref:Uncharacterized protein n=1 Tax=Methylobacterium gossipiicola TaxID=582675 RepID=A0A1I2TKY9_9HYPH|nr:hypothetical protein SAMN05192565_107181 [Methylobacterium gossipiicola]
MQMEVRRGTQYRCVIGSLAATTITRGEKGRGAMTPASPVRKTSERALDARTTGHGRANEARRGSAKAACRNAEPVHGLGARPDHPGSRGMGAGLLSTRRSHACIFCVGPRAVRVRVSGVRLQSNYPDSHMTFDRGRRSCLRRHRRGHVPGAACARLRGRCGSARRHSTCGRPEGRILKGGAHSDHAQMQKATSPIATSARPNVSARPEPVRNAVPRPTMAKAAKMMAASAAMSGAPRDERRRGRDARRDGASRPVRYLGQCQPNQGAENDGARDQPARGSDRDCPESNIQHLVGLKAERSAAASGGHG